MSRLGAAQLRARGAAVLTLNRGGVILYPTEGIWGLGCDPACRSAVEQLLRIKRRPVRKGLILVAGTPAQLQPWVVRWTPAEQARLAATWPGPHTWVVGARLGTPAWITGSRSSVAVRVSAHPAIRDLCRASGSALVSTSANLSGTRPLSSEMAARRLFAREGVRVWPGVLGGARRPSTIRHLQSGKVLRS